MRWELHAPCAAGRATSASGEEERQTLPMWSMFKEKEQRGRQDLIFPLKKSRLKPDDAVLL